MGSFQPPLRRTAARPDGPADAGRPVSFTARTARGYLPPDFGTTVSLTPPESGLAYQVDTALLGRAVTLNARDKSWAAAVGAVRPDSQPTLPNMLHGLSNAVCKLLGPSGIPVG